MVCCQHGGGSYQLIGLLERALSLADGTLARLAREFGDLIQLLCQVCLDELELGLVGAEQLGASIGVERVGHGCGYGGDCGGVSAKQDGRKEKRPLYQQTKDRKQSTIDAPTGKRLRLCVMRSRLLSCCLRDPRKRRLGDAAPLCHRMTADTPTPATAART